MDQVTLFQVAIWCLRQQADDSLVPMITNLEQRVAVIQAEHEDRLQTHITQIVDLVRKGYTIASTPVLPDVVVEKKAANQFP